MRTPPADQYLVTILRDTSLTQSLDLRSRQALVPSALEGAYDKLTRIAQEQEEDMARTVKLRSSSELTDITLPDPVVGALLIGGAAGWDNGPDATDIADAQANAAAAAASADASAASAVISANAAFGVTFATVSGPAQTLDISAANFFDAGLLTADTTLTFASLPAGAKWEYTFTGKLLSTYQSASDTGKLFSLTGVYGYNFNTSGGCDISADGDRFYLVGSSGTNSLIEFIMTTPFDLDTMEYSYTFDLSPITGLSDVRFGNNGKFVFFASTGDDKIFRRSLAEPYNLNTMRDDEITFDVSTETLAPRGLAFKDDGTRMYVSNAGTNTMYQYDLSVAWDITTSVLDGSSGALGFDSIFWKPDGSLLYQTSTGYEIKGYGRLTDWDITSTPNASTTLVSETVAGAVIDGYCIGNSGTKLYIVDRGNSNIREWDIGGYAQLTLPASVVNDPQLPVKTERVTYEFYTTDGASVWLIGETFT